MLQEVAAYDMPQVDAQLHPTGEPLGLFSEKFEDTDESWATWHALLTGTYNDEEEGDDEEEEDEEDEDEDEEEEWEVAGEGMAPSSAASSHRNSVNLDMHEEGDMPPAQTLYEGLGSESAGEINGETAAFGCLELGWDGESQKRTRDVGVGGDGAGEEAVVEGGEQALREMVRQLLKRAAPEFYTVWISICFAYLHTEPYDTTIGW